MENNANDARRNVINAGPLNVSDSATVHSNSSGTAMTVNTTTGNSGAVTVESANSNTSTTAMIPPSAATNIENFNPSTAKKNNNNDLTTNNTTATAVKAEDTNSNSGGSDKDASDTSLVGNDPFGLIFGDEDSQMLQQQQQQTNINQPAQGQQLQSQNAQTQPKPQSSEPATLNHPASSSSSSLQTTTQMMMPSSSSHGDAAAAAVANLQTIATESIAANSQVGQADVNSVNGQKVISTNANEQALNNQPLKRKSEYMDHPGNSTNNKRPNTSTSALPVPAANTCSQNTSSSVPISSEHQVSQHFSLPKPDATTSTNPPIMSSSTVTTTATTSSCLGNASQVGGVVQSADVPLSATTDIVTQMSNSTTSTAPAPTAVPSSSSSITNSTGGKKKMTDSKREERNAREKERSFRIAKQINELRELLSSGGVIVPKGTKSSVLTEAANYIRMLQQHQYRSEIDRHQLIQQMQVIGQGALGPQAANAIRHVATQNGVFSLGNFGGVPPKSAMTLPQEQNNVAQGDISSANNSQTQPAQQQRAQAMDSPMLTKIEEHDYRLIFNSSLVAMAIASMGGAFIDCNQLFSQISEYTKQEICGMTIFNLTSRADLQHAFDLVSQMISPPLDDSAATPRCVLRGSMKNRMDIGLSITLIKGDDGIAKCFCVTLIQNPESPFDTSKPVPASVNVVPSHVPAGQQKQHQQHMDGNSQVKGDSNSMGTATFMTG